ncbi:hypothetical protein KO465_04020 [Candidatus Micrarchaeota archaeon]|nr:hypothetical protein [Candidatus Micrarchaeota archaeon]
MAPKNKPIGKNEELSNLLSNDSLNKRAKEVADSVMGILEKTMSADLQYEDKKALFFGILVNEYTPLSNSALPINELLIVTNYFYPSECFPPSNQQSILLSSFGVFNQSVSNSFVILKNIDFPLESDFLPFINNGRGISARFMDLSNTNKDVSIFDEKVLAEDPVLEFDGEISLFGPASKNILGENQVEDVTFEPGFSENEISSDPETPSLGEKTELKSLPSTENREDVPLEFEGPIPESTQESKKKGSESLESLVEVDLEFEGPIPESTQESKKEDPLPGSDGEIDLIGDLEGSIDEIMREMKNKKEPTIVPISASDIERGKKSSIGDGDLTNYFEKEETDLSIDEYLNRALGSSDIDELIRQLDEGIDQEEDVDRTPTPANQEKPGIGFTKKELERHFLNYDEECKEKIKKFANLLRELRRVYQCYLREAYLNPHPIFVEYKDLYNSSLLRKIFFDIAKLNQKDLEIFISIIQGREINADLLDNDAYFFKNDRAIDEGIFLDRYLGQGIKKLHDTLGILDKNIKHNKFLKGLNWLGLKQIQVSTNFRGGEELGGYLYLFHNCLINFILEYYYLDRYQLSLRSKYHELKSKYQPEMYDADEQMKYYIAQKIKNYFKKFLKDYRERGYYKALELNNTPPEGINGPTIPSVLLAITKKMNFKETEIQNYKTSRELKDFEWIVAPLDLIFILFFIVDGGTFDPLAELWRNENRRLRRKSRLFNRPKGKMNYFELLIEKFGFGDANDFADSSDKAYEDREKLAVERVNVSVPKMIVLLKEIDDFNDDKQKEIYLEKLLDEGFGIKNEFFPEL